MTRRRNHEHIVLAALALSIAGCDGPLPDEEEAPRAEADCGPEIVRVSIACVDDADFTIVDGVLPDMDVTSDDEPGNDHYNENDDLLRIDGLTLTSGPGCEYVDDIDKGDAIILVYDDAAAAAAEGKDTEFRNFKLPNLRELAGIAITTISAGPAAGLIDLGVTELSINGLLGKARDAAAETVIDAVTVAYEKGIKLFNESSLTRWSRTSSHELVTNVDFESSTKIDPVMSGAITAVGASGGQPRVKTATWILDTELDFSGKLTVDKGVTREGRLTYEIGDSEWHYVDGPLHDYFPIGSRAWFQAVADVKVAADVEGVLDVGLRGHVTVKVDYDADRDPVFMFEAYNGDVNKSDNSGIRPVFELDGLTLPGNLTSDEPGITAEFKLTPNVELVIGGEQFGFNFDAEATGTISPKVTTPDELDVIFKGDAGAHGKVFAHWKDEGQLDKALDLDVTQTLECMLTVQGAPSCTTPPTSPN